MQGRGNSTIGQSFCSDVCQQCLDFMKASHQYGCKTWEIIHILKKVSMQQLDVISNYMKLYQDQNRICQSHNLPLDFYIQNTQMLGCKDCVDFGRQNVNTISEMNPQQKMNSIQTIQRELHFNPESLKKNVEKNYEETIQTCNIKFRAELMNNQQNIPVINNQNREYMEDIEQKWNVFLNHRKYNELIKLSGPKPIHSKLHTGYYFELKELMDHHAQNPRIDELVKSYYRGQS